MKLHSHGNVISSSRLADVQRLNHAVRKDLRPATGKAADGGVDVRLADGSPSGFRVTTLKVNVDAVTLLPDGRRAVLAWGKTADGTRKQGLVAVEDLKLDKSVEHAINKNLRALKDAPAKGGQTVHGLTEEDQKKIDTIDFFSPSRGHHNSQLPQARALDPDGNNRVLAQSLPNQKFGGGSRTHLTAGSDEFHASKIKARQYDTKGSGKGKNFVEWTYGYVNQGGKKVYGWLITGYKTAKVGFKKLIG